MILREANINEASSNLLGSIACWVESGRDRQAVVGDPPDEALIRALKVRRQIRDGVPSSLDGADQGTAADLLYAVCRSLMDDALEAPRGLLEEALGIRNYLETLQWHNDDLEEKKVLFCSLTFVAWRAARNAGLHREIQQCESDYLRCFRDSLQQEIAESALSAAEPMDSSAERQLVWSGPEAVLQALFYLHDSGEASPRTVSSRAALLYRVLREDGGVVPSDLLPFFLGYAALLAGVMARHTGSARDAEEWATIAEGHFRGDASSRAGLGRVTFLRLGILYERSDCDLVARAARSLDESFLALGMLEDWVKCRVLWAAALKILGRFQEGLEVLDPVKEIRDQIRPALFGWVLLQSGDLQQICGNDARALEELLESGRLLQAGKQFTGLADVKVMISCVYRSHGRLNEALQLLLSSCEEHTRLGMRSLEASSRMLIAETYLAMGRAREAEREIRLVLPILEEESMLPDTVVAANILREALSQQSIDSRRAAPRRKK